MPVPLMMCMKTYYLLHQNRLLSPVCAATAVVAACLIFLPNAQAVNPPPDGGYSNFNTAEGTNALLHLTAGANNTAVGWSSLGFVTTGNLNTGLGTGTLLFNTADGNTASGAGALLHNTTGSYNTAVGATALSNNTSGSHNIAVGAAAGFNITTASNVICIGDALLGMNVSNSCYIGQIFGATAAGGSAVFIDVNGKLGTVTSSKRFKQDIKQVGKGSEALFSLEPVTFRYKKEIDPAGTQQFGLVAEDVEKVNPDLILRDKEGKPYSVRYDQIDAMLLNEFLKDHKKLEEQVATIAQLKSMIADQQKTSAQQRRQIEALTSSLRKVSVQLEAIKPVPQLVLNSQ